MRRSAGTLIALLVAGCQIAPLPSAPAATGPSPGPTTPPRSPTSTEEPSPSASADAGEYTTGSIRWTRVGLPDPACGVTAAIVRRDGGLLAVCADFAARDGVQVLASPDGRHWTRSKAIGMAPQAPEDVVLVNALVEAADGTLIAVGAEALDDISRGDAASWTSADGITWHRSPSADALADAEMLGVVATPTGNLAVGDDGFPGGNTQLPSLRGAAAWTSRDGLDWRRTPPPEAGSRHEMRGVVATRTGWAAWGDGAGPGDGLVWTSPDGRAWAASRPPRGGNWGPIARVVVSTAGLVGVGTWTTVANTGDEVTTYGLWGSADDGHSWTILPSSIDVTVGGLWDAATLNADVVATGGNGLVIRSRDGGETWSWMPPVPSGWLATLSPLLAFHGELIAFGREPTDAGTQVEVWIGAVVSY